MSQRKSAFIYSAELDKNGYPPDCPFNSHRAGLTRQKIHSMGLLEGDRHREILPKPASREELEKYHSSEYLTAIQEAEKGELSLQALNMGLGTPDCPVFFGMYHHACLAVGASITGAKLLLDKQFDIAFNPAGGFHHAKKENASGFCYLNDVVLAAMEMADGGKKVLILDLDVHHADGVQEAFYHRRDIMTISFHESGSTLFPGTGFVEEMGMGDGLGFAVNIPLPVGTYDGGYLRAFKEAAWPLIFHFQPEMIVLELGMDALAGDPLAHLNLTNNTYADIINELLTLNRPILAVGGGGYHIDHTVRGWALCWSIFCDNEGVDLNWGLGGVMLENTDWIGGLRDRTLITDAGRRSLIDAEINKTIAKIHKILFPVHGL